MIGYSVTNRRAQFESGKLAVSMSAGGVVFILATSLVLGCGDGQKPSVQNEAEKKPEKSMETTLLISRIKDGQEWRIGTLTFDAANAGKLTIQQNGPDADQLREAWEEMSKLKSLPLEFRHKTEIDGKEVIEHKAIDVSKDNDRYPDAVWSYLEKRYKFLVDQKL